MIAYEVSIGLILLSVLFCVTSLNFSEIVFFQENIWFIIPHFASFILFFISALAETNRAPFDLPEAEAELVSGYNVEYSAMSFALFFLAEYANIIFISTLIVLLFFGVGLHHFFLHYFYFKNTFYFDFIYLGKNNVTTLQYDQLMQLGWKVFLPLSLGLVLLNLLIAITFYV
jgi:NADH-quinone oxidoreductase subunit H